MRLEVLLRANLPRSIHEPAADLLQQGFIHSRVVGRLGARDGFTAESAEEWTPRELRHSFVSLLSDVGVPIEEISRLVGHAGTTVTELVHRHQIRPVVATGAEVMDRIFPARQASGSDAVTPQEP